MTIDVKKVHEYLDAMIYSATRAKEEINRGDSSSCTGYIDDAVEAGNKAMAEAMP